MALPFVSSWSFLSWQLYIEMSKVIASLVLDEKTVMYIMALERANQVVALAGTPFLTKHCTLERNCELPAEATVEIRVLNSGRPAKSSPLIWLSWMTALGCDDMQTSTDSFGCGWVAVPCKRRN
jgi:hypothetical protein